MTVPWRLDDAGMNDLLVRAFVRPIKKAPTWGRGWCWCRVVVLELRNPMMAALCPTRSRS